MTLTFSRRLSPLQCDNQVSVCPNFVKANKLHVGENNLFFARRSRVDNYPNSMWVTLRQNNANYSWYWRTLIKINTEKNFWKQINLELSFSKRHHLDINREARCLGDFNLLLRHYLGSLWNILSLIHGERYYCVTSPKNQEDRETSIC